MLFLGQLLPCNSMTQLEAVDDRETTSLMSHEALIAEIKRLRERLITLETENASMSIKLSQQQWEVCFCMISQKLYRLQTVEEETLEMFDAIFLCYDIHKITCVLLPLTYVIMST
jgi:hypothetical protein